MRWALSSELWAPSSRRSGAGEACGNVRHISALGLTLHENGMTKSIFPFFCWTFKEISYCHCCCCRWLICLTLWRSVMVTKALHIQKCVCMCALNWSSLSRTIVFTYFYFTFFVCLWNSLIFILVIFLPTHCWYILVSMLAGDLISIVIVTLMLVINSYGGDVN